MKSNRIPQLFRQKRKILNVFITAGYPNLNDTISIVKSLAANGVDMIEIGMPFSDPLADGPTIQRSSEVAIANGITMNEIFNQVRIIRQSVDLPILLMGYYNQLMQYGVEAFLKNAQKAGVDGLIIPDLPLSTYLNAYQPLFLKYNIKISFLITPQTDEERILAIAKESSAFLYVVSSYSITGGTGKMGESQRSYFERIRNLGLTTPSLIGFGINNHDSFKTACQYADGAIIGSAFIKALGQSQSIDQAVKTFVASIKEPSTPFHQ